MITREQTCRYCERYGRACGRTHSEQTKADWGRDWRGNAPEQTPRTEVTNPTQLRAGDVVQVYGARVQVYGEPHTYEGSNGRTVYAWKGRILNLAEVQANSLFNGLLDGDSWTVQGNELAATFREVNA